MSIINSYSEFTKAFENQFGQNVPDCLEQFKYEAEGEAPGFKQNDTFLTYDGFMRAIPRTYGAFLGDMPTLTIKDGSVATCIEQLALMPTFIALVKSDDPVVQASARIKALMQTIKDAETEIAEIQKQLDHFIETEHFY